MADITQEYAVDPLTGQSIAVDPPLQQSETPLMGNSILTRGDVPRKKGRSNTALYAGAAFAVVAVLAGGAYLMASGNHNSSGLMTTAATTPSAQQQAAATPAPMITPAPRAAAPIVAAADTRELPVQPTRMARADRAQARMASRTVHPAAQRAAARAASESGADTAVTVSPGQVARSSSVATPQAAPPMTAAPPAPVITPPPPAQ